MKRAACTSLLWVAFSLPLFAKTITVDLNGARDFTGIQQQLMRRPMETRSEVGPEQFSSIGQESA